jgi:hypothetical protein
LTLMISALTCLIYPVGYYPLMANDGIMLTIYVIRNLSEVALLVLAVIELIHAGRRQVAQAAQPA